MMNRICIPPAALLLLVLTPTSFAQKIPVDGYAAKVNQRVITVGEVLEAIRPMERQIRDVYEGDELKSRLETAFQQGLDQLINQALILEDFAQKENMRIPEELVDERVREIVHDRFNDDRAAFLQALAEEGMTLDEWRQSVKDRLTVMILKKTEVTDKVKVAPGDVYQAYLDNIDIYKKPEEVSLRMIVLHKGVTASDAEFKRGEADDIRAKLLSGGSFEALAQEFSEGTRKDSGGDWGWIHLKDLRPEIRDAVGAMKPGEVSAVIDTHDDYFIVKLEARKEATVVPYEEVKDEIEQQLRAVEDERLFDDWMARLKQKYYVKVFGLHDTAQP